SAYLYRFFVYRSVAHPHLHSFPTRRSSDLKISLDLLLVDMHRRRDDVAWRFLAKLDDVLAKVGLNRLDAISFEVLVERDLLGKPRLALGDRAGVQRAANREHGFARLFRGGTPVHLAAHLQDLRLVALQIVVEVSQGVVLDRLCLVAKLIELRQARGRLNPLVNEAAPHMSHSLLE